MTPEDIYKNSEFVVPEPVDPKDKSIIKVIGVGGGGGNAVDYMYKLGVKGVKYVVCNTDKQALDNSPVPDRVLLGHTGLGAGDKPKVAQEAAEESIDAINTLFDQDTKMVFITAGMGGGTGTGAAPVVARAAKEHGVLTVGIVTIPFFFEGIKKIKKALAGAEEIRKYVDALLLINNERLIEIYPDLNFDCAFSKADDTLATAARSISDLITNDNVRINIDFNDVDTTLRDGGSAIISCGYGEGENRVEDAINAALKSPLLRNNNILGSKRLLFDLAYSRTAKAEFMMGEMQAFTDFVNSIEDVEVIHGVSYDDELGDKIKVTILASGFESETLVPERTKPTGPKLPTKAKDTDDVIIEDIYNKDIKKKHFVVLKPEQMDDDEIIDRLENTPTATRTKESRQAITDSSTPREPITPQQPKAAQPSKESGVIEF